MTVPRIADRYEVLRPIGEGPLGKVFQVVDHARSGGFATLKILRAEAVREDGLSQRIETLLPRLAEVDHPFVRVPLDAGRTPLGLVFLASEYADGEDLRAVLRRRGPLHPRRVLAIARGLAEALAALHDLDLAHGDLHPGNVLLAHRAPFTDGDPFGTEVVLLDPCALELAGGPRPASLAPYAAPELAAGAPPTPAADVWAAGAILLELALGRSDGSPADVPEPLAAICARALAADPAERFAGGAELLDALPSGDDGREAASLAAELSDLRAAYDRDLGTSFQRLAERDAAIAALRGELDGRAAGGDGGTPAERELAAARAELEELRARRPRKGGGSALFTAAAALVALVALGLWWRERGARPVLAQESAELVADAEQRLADAREEHAAELAVKDAALAERERLLAATRGDLEAFQAAAREEQAAAAAARAELERAREDALARDRRIEEQEEAQAELARSLTALQEELSRARDPELAALDQLDRVLAALAESDGQAARARHTLLALSHPDAEGLDALGALVDGALALDRAAAAADPLERIERVVEAELALARADEGAGVERVAGAAWVRREGDRRARGLAEARAAVAAELAAEQEALEQRLEARWSAILAASPDVPPREVLAISDRLGDERLAEFVDWLARFLSDEVERGGMLELPRLLAFEHLEAWADAIDARPELHGTASARDVLLFRYARAWRSTPADEPAPDLPVKFQSKDGGPPPPGWRRDLALRAALAAEDAGWPGGVGSRFLYHVRASASGAETENWQLDQVLEREPDAWTVKRTYYRADGSFLDEATVRIERHGRRLVEAGAGLLLDAAGDLAAADAFTPEKDVRPPEELVDPESWRAFRERLRAETPDALAFEVEGLLSWYSPELGLLAKEDGTRFRRELAYADPRP